MAKSRRPKKSAEPEKPKLDPVADYALKVVAGEIPAGELVRKACARHLKDLETGHERGISFDLEAAKYAVEKMQIFNHSKGEWAGQPFVLSPWQLFIVGSLFGWKNQDGTRRFRVAYVEVARKNGKSSLLALLCNYMLYFDGEQGAEIYTAATKKEQSRLVFDEAVNMIRKCPSSWKIRKELKIYGTSVSYLARASKMMPLSADSHTMDGLNPSFVTIDELHAHKTRGVFDVLNTAQGSRRQPLLVSITTAGWDRNSVCWQQHEYAERVLQGVFDDDQMFAYIAGCDKGDDYADPATWEKANPNYGISVKPEYLKAQCGRAQKMPSELNSFLRLHLNVWTEQADRWIDMDTWDSCGAEYTGDELAGRPCFGALDMSSTQDISAFSLAFPPRDETEPYKFLHWFWVPQENIRMRAEKDRVDYAVWVRQGFIEATEGNVVDYNVVQSRILQICEKFQVKEIAFDRWNVTQMVTNLLGEGLNMVQFGQGYVSMSAPTKALSDLIVSKKMAHNKNPVLRWMMSNVACTTDPAGNMKPDKQRSSEKIDGVVTMVMGLGRATVSDVNQKSVYEVRGLRSL